MMAKPLILLLAACTALNVVLGQENPELDNMRLNQIQVIAPPLPDPLFLARQNLNCDRTAGMPQQATMLYSVSVFAC